MYTVRAISNARDYTHQVQFQLFLKAGRVLVSRIAAGRVRGPATSKYVDQRPKRPDRLF